MTSTDRAQADQALQALSAAWLRERDSVRAQVRSERLSLSLAERVERGLALRDLVVEDSEASAGGRALLWLRPRNPTPRPFDDLRLSPGEPVRLWSRDPEGQEVEAGVVARVGASSLGVMVAAEYAEFLDHGAFQLDREAPEVSFERGARAIGALVSAKEKGPAAKWRDLLFGARQPILPEARPLPAADAYDSGLNASQRAAIGFALDAPDLALIHGPPGTGKTRTLVELIRQALRRSERILVSAASNTAVDNLAERLIAAGVSVLRLGHPARVSDSVLESTLDARLDRSDARRLARRLKAEAVELRRRIQKRKARGALDYREARELMDQAKAAMREANAQLDLARELIFAEAKVVCATAVGADPALLASFKFDRVVLDEATQAVDPIALAALLQAERAVLAGDPCQLPPTVIDPEAAKAGLSTSLFERALSRHGASLCRLLDVQYRMHPDLMRFPAESMYAGQLTAAEHLADQTLTALGLTEDPARPGPLIFLDTAGKGWTDQRSDDDPSTQNPGNAERVALEAERLFARGLLPKDLAIITPYTAQARALRDRLRGACDQGLEIETIDAFQGREKQAVILDLVRSNDESDLGFLRDTRRMNVALTRAKSHLMVVGDSATLSSHAYYQQFMETADQQNATLSAWSDDGTWQPQD